MTSTRSPSLLFLLLHHCPSPRCSACSRADNLMSPMPTPKRRGAAHNGREPKPKASSSSSSPVADGIGVTMRRLTSAPLPSPLHFEMGAARERPARRRAAPRGGVQPS
ncbi:hypothetical protein DAI22_05g140701 [Oryza sativa Japonica Group]|nr:hypothetical protein DAI22_05g140701 [Oryza sativa Japonica Group]